MKKQKRFSSFQESTEAISKNILQNVKGGTATVIDIVVGNIARV